METISNIISSTIGFVLAIILIGAVLIFVVYEYHTYVQNQVLEDYLWPVAEVVPTGSGTYYLAVINTGHQPFNITYIFYPNGTVQAVNQGPLYEDQHWLSTVYSMPAEVMVCSTVNPHVCTTVPVNNYTIVPLLPPCVTSGGAMIMSLSTSQEIWGVPHVYQGIVNGQPSTSTPSLVTLNGNPYLQLTPATTSAGGAMYWCAKYTSSTPVTIILFGTYTQNYELADGFYAEFFIQPNGWSISSQYNWSLPYTTTNNLYVVYNPGHLYIGTVIFPYANGPYLIVQWDPYYGPAHAGLPGEWNIIVVTSATSSGAYGYWWAGEGSGAFAPNPGDILEMIVTYNPNTNTVYGIMEDLNTGAISSVSLNLNGYFTPPSSGWYVFGIGGATGGAYANWATNYVSFQG